jgi:superfamily II helicase
MEYIPSNSEESEEEIEVTKVGKHVTKNTEEEYDEEDEEDDILNELDFVRKVSGQQLQQHSFGYFHLLYPQ